MSLDDSYPSQLSLLWLPKIRNDGFLIPSLLLHLLVGFLIERKYFLLSIYLIYIYGLWMLILFTVITHFDASVVPDLILCALFYVIRICSRLILHFLCSNPGVSHFSKDPLFLLVENDIWKLRPNIGYVHCYWSVIASKSSQ